MARFNMGDAEHYGGSGGTGFFKLENDKDVARVRFLYSSIDDVEGYAIHKVKAGVKDNGKPNYINVNCLREYGQPLDDCPFCRDQIPQQAKIFIPVYNVDADQCQVWERGKTFFSKISSLCSRYKNPVSYIFEVERHGKANDTNTTYEIYASTDEDTGEILKDDSTVDDFQLPQVLGKIVLEKTAEDMEYFLQERQFPPDGDDEEVPVRRGGRRREEPEDEEEEAPRRRTAGRRAPANRQDRF